MNILFVYFDKTIQNDNLYVKSLCEEIRRQNGSIECSIDAFWNSTRKYDIVHIQFPEVIFKWRQPSDNGLKALRQRIARLKSMGTKIVYPRHDAIPHYCTDKNKLELYRIVETQSNAIIHLGEYSRQEFARIYPENTARHFVIPHHIYDSCGYAFPSKLTSRNKLGLPTDKFIILTFGSYRNEEEQRLVVDAFEHLPMSDKFLLAPGFYNSCFTNRKTPIQNLLRYRTQKKKFRLDTNRALQLHEKISNTELPYYFSATDIVLIQRKEILNSGNVPMALFFHKVVAGPKFGNIGELLDLTGNPTFDLTDSHSVIEAIAHARQLANTGYGEKNAEFARQNMNTELIAQKTILCYQQIYNLTLHENPTDR